MSIESILSDLEIDRKGAYGSGQLLNDLLEPGLKALPGLDKADCGLDGLEFLFFMNFIIFSSLLLHYIKKFICQKYFKKGYSK